jgi:hypothetical protein
MRLITLAIYLASYPVPFALSGILPFVPSPTFRTAPTPRIAPCHARPARCTPLDSVIICRRRLPLISQNRKIVKTECRPIDFIANVTINAWIDWISASGLRLRTRNGNTCQTSAIVGRIMNGLIGSTISRLWPPEAADLEPALSASVSLYFPFQRAERAMAKRRASLSLPRLRGAADV